MTAERYHHSFVEKACSGVTAYPDHHRENGEQCPVRVGLGRSPRRKLRLLRQGLTPCRDSLQQECMRHQA